MTAENVYTVFFGLGGLFILYALIAIMERWKQSSVEPLIDPDRLRFRLNQLNGWHRLGLSLVVVWSVITGAAFINQWERINASYERSISQPTEQPVSTRLRYRRRPVAEVYESRSRERGELTQFTLFRWLAPITGMYVVAYGVVWVRDGFRR